MSLYSEMMGSFIRTGNYPIEANYIFPDVESLKTFYEDPINATTLHEGLLKVVQDDGDGNQALYWASPNSEGVLEFVKLTDSLNILDLLDKANGITTYESLDDRDSSDIPQAGTICYVTETDTYYRVSQDGAWVRFISGGSSVSASVGIPILNQTLIAENKNDLPDEYIVIPDSDSDLEVEASEDLPTEGTYVGILFSAIRKLQAEVNRLKNSYQYGIYSLTDENTAMSELISGVIESDDEPLWAIEENDLSSILEVPIGQGSGLTPSTNIDVSTSGLLKISDAATWNDNGDIQNASDAKLFAYITTSNLNYTVTLSTADGNNLTFKLSDLVNNTLSSYNTMICISRATSDNGTNYIYVSIGSATRDKIIAEGYLTSANTLSETYMSAGSQYYFKLISFTDLNLTKLNFYSRYQDFSNSVIPSTIDTEDLMYRTAHITIRSVKTYEVLNKIKDLLPNNELIFVENTKRLYIKNNNILINIGASGGGSDDPENTDTGMELDEIIALLESNGIIISEEGGNLSLNNIADVTFIHEATGKRFKIQIDAEGNLVTTELYDESLLLSNRIATAGMNVDFEAAGSSIDWGPRGFIARLRQAEYNKANPTANISETSDFRLMADRVKIGAVYAPLDTSNVFGCTRAFVELENTSDQDVVLEGCYLHFATYNANLELVVYHLPLTGVLKAGGTYVIAGKRYAEDSDTNSFIKVNSYDQEWYINGELIDFTIKSETEDKTRKYGYGFALTYQNANLLPTTTLWATTLDSDGWDKSTFKLKYHPCFIDAINLNNDSGTSWAQLNPVVLTSNSMYKNTFELDPAKQAFQSTNVKDSSRSRWQNANTDYWIVDLSEEYISFPHSSETYPVSKFTPKASFDNKNVCTDKTKLNTNKPNAIVCGFGADLHKDRTFNWVSSGVFDEYVFIRKKGGETWDSIIESFNDSSDFLSEGEWSRKTPSDEMRTAAYNRIIRRFPADNSLFTSHKCIVTINSEVDSPTTFEYIIGQKDKNNNPINASEIRTFTVYPRTYTPRIYQITDQQGFHWLEYQAWAAAANAMNVKIASDMASENIFPVIINTGDVTQNGTRVNEWLDYFNAGDVLFSKYEQLNIVGNNDLCGTNPDDLGTGDDQGKSNGYFFHLFNCVDVDESVFTPIVNGVYVPSLYFVDSDKYRFVMINTEITKVNCQYWFGLVDGNNEVTNIYTGFKIKSREYDNSFTSIYTMIYHMLDTDKECIPACHEMPYTVITQDNIQTDTAALDRSGSGNTGSTLVGSHCNRISGDETGLTSVPGVYNGVYWLSRLFEYFKVKLVIGGHKHTYAVTYPVREYFKFNPTVENKVVTSWGGNSKDNFSSYVMEETLENDKIGWIDDNGYNTTKLPLTKRDDAGTPATSTVFYPYTQVSDLEGGIVYFMCQATGYKLTSNKELPSPYLKFSMLIPKTTVADSGGSALADGAQKYPMFGIMKLGDNITVELARVTNIMVNGNFRQLTYGTNPMTLQYLALTSANDYGVWGDSEVEIITL